MRPDSLEALLHPRQGAMEERAIIEGDKKAGVAQSVEQLIRNEKVGCSIHLSGTNKDKESPLSKP